MDEDPNLSPVYAHSIKNAPAERWQTMRDHAMAVAELAAERGMKFGASELARVAGLLHDVGKYSDSFQRKLKGEALRVDHSTAGARIAAERYAQLGRLLAYVIAGHHAGLADGTGEGGPTPLDLRLDPKRYLDVPVASGWEHEIALPAGLAWAPPAPNTDRAVARQRRGLSLSVLVRMVFSALVDADRLDTEAFYAKAEQRRIERGGWQLLPRLKEQLDRFMAAKAAGAGPSRVNLERARILNAARIRAADEPGLFSLTVPTGGGKTLASLTFGFDHAVKHGLDRVIYVIPFTSIIEQTAMVFREALGPLADHVIEHHSAFREDEALRKLEQAAGGESGLQAGERLRLAAENWDAPIIVTTAVQFFESLFSNRPSQCRKLHNIARSVVILDEAQTLPLRLLRPCVAVLDELARNYRTTIVLCTATQPAFGAQRRDGRDGFEGGLTGVREIVDDPDALYERLRRVTVKPAETLGDSGLIEQLRQHDRVLCIVGTRAHARDLFLALKDQPGTYHLSALMCPTHRSRKIKEIKAALEYGRCRLIATTVVEAGVDIDFPIVYRLMAGLDSIAQAAGRCNREGKLKREEAIVQLFETEGRRSVPELRINEDTARTILRRRDRDPLGLDAIEDYFGQLYWKKTQGRDDGLDASTRWPDQKRGSILERLNVRAAECLLPLASVAGAFRMIETAMEPVIIPYDEEGRRLLAELAKAERPGRLARKLQPYIVNVPRSAFERLRAIGKVKAVQEDRFEDEFMALTEEARNQLYSEDVGFDWSDPTFQKVGSRIA